MPVPDPAPDLPVLAVTGAGGALGRRAAERFLAAGHRVALFTRPAKLDALRERHPGAFAVGADLTDPAATRAAVEAVLERFGRIDALLNIAGGFATAGAAEATLADLERQLDRNLRTAFVTTGAVLPGMLERGSGAVLAVSAAAGANGGARMGPYAASKGALEAWLRSVRAEVEPKGVAASLLIPMGTLDTPANRTAMPEADPGGWIDLDAVVDAMAFLVARGPRGRVRELRVHPG